MGSQAQAGCENNIKRKLCWARHSQTEPDCRHCWLPSCTPSSSEDVRYGPGPDSEMLKAGIEKNEGKDVDVANEIIALICMHVFFMFLF